MKQPIKLKVSQARILIYLEHVNNGLRYGMKIASKLNMDYKYCLEQLNMMKDRKWVYTDEYAIKKYWFLSKKAPLDKAKELMG